MGQVLPVFAHCSEYGEDLAWFGAQKPAWGPLWVSIFGARRGLEVERVEGKEPKETKESFPSPPLPPPTPRFGGNWDILTRRTRCSGAEVGVMEIACWGALGARDWVAPPSPRRSRRVGSCP